MDVTNTRRTAKGEEDALNAWLDGCYRKWRKTYQLPVFALLLLAWIPAAYFLMFQFFQEELITQFGRGVSTFRFQMMGYSPAVCYLFAISVASASTSSLRYSSEVRLSSSKMQLFKILRNSVRRRAYIWMLVLIFVPNYAPIIIYSARNLHGEWLFLVSTSDHIESLSVWLLHLALVSFTGAELTQFLALRFNHIDKLLQVVVLLTIGGFFIAVMWFWDPLAGHVSWEPRWFYWTSKLMVGCGPPAIVALYFMLATRKPTPAMLERV